MNLKQMASFATVLFAGVAFDGDTARLYGETGTVPLVPVAATSVAFEGPVQSVETESGPYQGFDTLRYPGDTVMRAWREAGDFDWVGFYLPAPCHRDTSWSGTRETIENMGWGTAIIYVGQQTWGARPRRSSALGTSTTCYAHVVGAARGVVDADDAIAATEAEGFPYGTLVVLDLEYMSKVPQAMRDYYLAWTARLLADGRYRPAYYAHAVNAETIYSDVSTAFVAAGVTDAPAFWIAGGSNFSRDKSPEEVGHQFAAAWQGMLDVVEKYAGVSLPIDVSVGALRSPSSSVYTIAE